MFSETFGRKMLISGLIATGLLAVPTAAHAQLMGIRGTVIDEKGRPVAGAAIAVEVISLAPSRDDMSVRTVERGQTWPARSNENGDYLIRVPYSGVFLVTASKEEIGSVATQVSLKVGSLTTANLRLSKASPDGMTEKECGKSTAIGAVKRSGIGAAGVPALARLLDWLEAVQLHTPGCSDPPAIEVGRWSQRELEVLLRDVRELVKFLQRVHEERAEWGGRTGGDRDRLIFFIHNRRFTLDELERIFYGKETLRANELLRRGALLHADVAEFVAGGRSAAPLVDDGGRKGWRPGTLHWEIGRQLLDSVTPAPGGDAGALLWYRAVSAYLFREGRLDEVSAHLDKARRVFPDHPVFLLDSAYLHEELSSPAIQAATQAVRADGVNVTVGSRGAELERAERFLRQAVAVAPDDADARLRHGHTLGELSRHEDAAAELRRVIDAKPGGAQLYLAELFLGRAEQEVGRFDEAKRRFENAVVLYPNAQAPRLALAYLARQSGDRAGALRAVRNLAAFSRSDERSDPWWSYYEPHKEDAETLIAQMRKLGSADAR